MKTGGFIFAFYILFLALYPALKECDLFAVQETGSCCNHACKPADKEEQSTGNHERGDMPCNPFQSCKCCFVLRTEIDFRLDSPEIVFGKPGTNYTENVPPQISIDFWQPPKIA